MLPTSVPDHRMDAILSSNFSAWTTGHIVLACGVAEIYSYAINCDKFVMLTVNLRVNP